MIVDQIEPVLGEVVIIQYDGDYSNDSDARTFRGNASAVLDNDCKYDGEFRNGMFHGKGTFVWPSGIKFDGDFERGNIIGKGQYEWSDGSTYLGDVFNGLRHGSGKFVGSSGQVYEGEWLDGKRHGKGKVWYNEDRTSSFTGDWVRNLRHGYGIMKYTSGNSYEGEWRDDKKCGSGLMVWRDVDEVYTGEWAEDLPHGLGEHIWGDSGSHTVKKEVCNIYRGSFVRGKRHGQGSFFYMNGSQYSGQWADDAKHGEGLFFYADGRIFGGMFQNNRMVTDYSKEETSAPRATEAVNPQFRLNISDVFDWYPALLHSTTATAAASSSSVAAVNISSVAARQNPGASRAEAKVKEVKEMERLLLKYNHYLRSALRKHTDLANKHRLRQALQQHQLLAAWAPTDVHSRAHKACATARILPKRLFCMNLQQMLRFLRECGIVGPFFRSFDLSQCMQQMREEAKIACIGKLREYRQQMWEVQQQQQRANTPTSPSSVLSPTQAEYGSGSPEAAQQGWEESPEETAHYISMRVPTIVDAYLQSGSWDPAFPSLAFQPLLEREFTELFVRAVAVRYARCKSIGAHYSAEMAAVQGMSLTQILYYVLAQKLLPVVSDPDQHTPAFYREFYFEEVQSQLYSADSPAAVEAATAAAPPSPTARSPKGAADAGGVTIVEPVKDGAGPAGTLSLTFFEKLWTHLRAQSGEVVKVCGRTQPSVCSVSDTPLNAMHSAGPPALSVNPTGGSVRLKQLVEFLLSLRGQAIAAEATEFTLLMAMECAPPHPMSCAPAPVSLFGVETLVSEPPPQEGAVSEEKQQTEGEGEPETAASQKAFAALNPEDFDLSCVQNRIDFEDFLELLCRVVAGPLWIYATPTAAVPAEVLPELPQSEGVDAAAPTAATDTTVPGISTETGVAASGKEDQDSVSVYSVSLADVLAERLGTWKQSFDLVALGRTPSAGTVEGLETQ